MLSTKKILPEACTEFISETKTEDIKFRFLARVNSNLYLLIICVLTLNFQLINLNCSAQQGTLSFFVRDAVNYYGTKATVSIQNKEGKTESLTTDNGGHLIYKADAGKYNLTIRAENHKPLNTYFTIEQGKELKAEIILDRFAYSPPPAQQYSVAVIDGYVVDGASGLPLKNVVIYLVTENKKVQTDDAGYFQIESARFSTMKESTDKPVRDIIVFEKTGYGTYEEKNIPLLIQKLTMRITLYPGDKKISSTYLHGVLDATSKKKESISEENNTEKWLEGTQPPSPLACIPVPGTIRVGTNCSCTSCSSVSVMSLESYVGSGLDDEWIASWHANSLNAGAVAYRTYGAWYVLNPVNVNFDIASTTCNQAWGPATYVSVQNAAAATASVIIEYNNAIARAEYSAENNNKGCGNGFSGTSTSWPCISDNVCSGQPSNGHGRGMCQWGSQRWANNQAQAWTWILNHYYNPGNYFISYPSGCSPASLSTTTAICPHDSVRLRWVNSGAGWVVDVTYDPTWARFYNKAVPNLTSIACPGGFANNINPSIYLEFKPNTTYYWRVWNGTTHTYGNSFITPSCIYQKTTCSGIFDDTGGPSAPYTGNEDYVTVIKPVNATSVTMAFTSFNLELNSDSLWIYNGLNTSAPLIGKYTGTNSPGTVVANSGAMTIRFKSDPYINNAGWTAAWNCVLNTTSVNSQLAVGSEQLTAYPNPFNESISINYFLNENSFVKIYLVDMIGREIALFNENNQLGGEHSIKVDTKNLSLTQGVYFLKLESKNKTSYVKMVRN